jgi:hypothetical protein
VEQNRRKIMKYSSLRMVFQSLTIVALLAALATAPLAGGIRKRIKFPRGSTGVTLKGAVVRGDRDVYVLGAGKGQLMKVKLTSAEDNAVFQIYAPNGKALKDATETDDATDWNGSLPQAGDYRVVVGGTRGNASYSLTVEIE